MNCINMSHRFFPDSIENNYMRKLEACARISHKSDMQMDDIPISVDDDISQYTEKDQKIAKKVLDDFNKNRSAISILSTIMKLEHYSVLEHYRIILEVDKDTHDTFGNRFIKKSMDEINNKKIYYISGNIRAFMDSYNTLDSSRSNSQYKVLNVISKEFPFFFQSFDNNEISFDDIKIIKADDIQNSYHRALHKSFSFILTTNISSTRQIVRHRDKSFVEQSTRYCNFSKDKFNNEISFVDITQSIDRMKLTEYAKNNMHSLVDIWFNAMKTAESYYFDILSLGFPPDVARSVLPLSTATEIVVTGTGMEIRDLLYKRLFEKSHADIFELFEPLLKSLVKMDNEIFSDILKKYEMENLR